MTKQAIERFLKMNIIDHKKLLFEDVLEDTVI